MRRIFGCLGLRRPFGRAFRWPFSRYRFRVALRAGALDASSHGWPVLPGARRVADGCSCGDRACPVPGGHPHDPSLLAATTDVRMIRWWWEQHRPGAPVLLATGGVVCAVSLPAAAGVRVLEYLAAARIAVGPVIEADGRCLLLTAPFTLDELGELLAGHTWVPGCLRYHGPEGYLPLPPSRTGETNARWVVPPLPGRARLPRIETLLDAAIAASSSLPDGSPLDTV